MSRAAWAVAGRQGGEAGTGKTGDRKGAAAEEAEREPLLASCLTASFP